jgi:hypothetical protein
MDDNKIAKVEAAQLRGRLEEVIGWYPQKLSTLPCPATTSGHLS